ncbi:MCE family protein [Nocardia fluminea]|jgi:phospholipid/cholesterol/gamma-HCH transport system substrate-binding protein|uniref:MCE family protein n=1 Tax=Nocardia fluminea TaxID=134984 RepID=UPI0033ECB39F
MNENKSPSATIGIVGVVLVVTISLATLQFTQLPFIRSGATFTANFLDAGGLVEGDPVHVAGVRSGEVRQVSLDGDKVLVKFDLDESIVLGEKTTAAIKTNTVLGRKSLDVVPTGPGAIGTGDTIPVDRTTSPYSLNEALSDLGGTVRDLDLDQVDQTLDTLSAAFADTPGPLRNALDGVTALSRSINVRDQALTDLLARAQNVTKILADRSTQLNTLLLDGNELLGELDRRRAAINQLIVYIDDVARQLSGLVADNEPQMRPTLDRLNSVLALLQRNEQNLNGALDGLGPYAAALGEQVGNGPWFNAYVVNATSTELRPLVDALVWPEQVPQDLIDIFTHPRTPYIAPTEEDPPR